jgi:molecular chaperone HtpG
MVHSVYSETDIFLRELISNASDACDKLRYEAIAHPELIGDGAPPEIRIVPDKKANTLAVIDSGIGMDRQELIDNLGTIARSGTKSFLARLTEAKDGANLIGQFGVGFYAPSWWPSVSSSPAAAPDQTRLGVVVVGRRGFEIRAGGRGGDQRGSARHRDRAAPEAGCEKISRAYEIERIVRAYSDNIQFPIELVPEEGEPRQINSASALWQRLEIGIVGGGLQAGLSIDRRRLRRAGDDAALRAEGRQSYAVLLFAPSTKPFDLFDQARKGTVKLYVPPRLHQPTMPSCCRPTCASSAA